MDHVTKRRVAVAVLAIAFTGVPAFSQLPDRTPPARPAELSAILDAWVQNSSRIKSLSARLSRKDKRHSLSPTGEYFYELLWRNSGQADLKIEATDRRGKPELFERIIWTGRDVWQYNPRKKEIEVSSLKEIGEYEVFREWMMVSSWGRWIGNRFDLIFPKLSNPREIDPLPFLVGMKAIVARKLLVFELLEDTSPNRIVVRATPNDPKLKASFDDVVITLDKERYLPIEVVYQRGWRGKDTRRYTFLEVKLDPPLADSAIVPVQIMGWALKLPDDTTRTEK